MPKKFLDKIVDKIVKSGEKIANIVAVILISTGINLLTGLATSSIKDLNSTYHLFLGSLFFLCGGILSFLFGARIKDAYEEANRIFIYSAIDRVVNSISYLAIKAMKRNDKKAKINRLFVFFIIVSIIGGIFSLFSKFFFSINMQFILNGVYAGAIYIIIAIGFGLIYATSRFFHFAHAVVFTGGAYFALLFKNYLGLPLWVTFPLAVGGSALLGSLMDVGVYRPLRRKKSSSMILLLASVGIYIVLQNVVSMVFGDDTRSIRSGVVKEGLNVFGARITPIQIVIICTSIVLVVLLALFLKWTKVGKAMRAVANDPEMAEISGIDSDLVILWTFVIGSALAGIAGILVALDVDMTPTMGMNAMMMGVVVVIIGGVGSIPGVALGALLLGMAQHLGVWKISSQWQDAIAFIILFVFLLLKPEGFLGKKVKKAKI